MKRMSECINEGFFGRGYDKYKDSVLDILKSLGLRFDDDGMRKVEEWTREFYRDRMDKFDCARSIFDDFKRSTVRETIDQLAADVIDGTPLEKRRSIAEAIRTMTSSEKREFDAAVDRMCSGYGVTKIEAARKYGSKIVEAVKRGMAYDDACDYAWNHKMSVGEALMILKESGVLLEGEESFLRDLYAALSVEFKESKYENTVTMDESVKKIYITDDDDPWLVISYIPSAEKVCVENLSNRDTYLEFYPKLQGGAEGVASRIFKRFGVD